MMTEVSPPTEPDRSYRVVAHTLDRQRQARQSVFDGLTRQEVSHRFVAGLTNPRLLRRPDHPLHGQRSLTELRIYEKKRLANPAAGTIAGEEHPSIEWVDVTAEFTEAAGLPEARAWIGELLARYRWWLLGGGAVLALVLARCASADGTQADAQALESAHVAVCIVSEDRIISSRRNYSHGSRVQPCELSVG
jgi:hypothetical protein